VQPATRSAYCSLPAQSPQGSEAKGLCAFAASVLQDASSAAEHLR